MPRPRNVNPEHPVSSKRRRAPVVTSRQDGRPEAYDLEGGMQSACHPCIAENKHVRYPRGEVFMVNPNDNPTNSGTECYMCKPHLEMLLPNVVIVDPENGFECRDLKGNTWRESSLL